MITRALRLGPLSLFDDDRDPEHPPDDAAHDLDAMIIEPGAMDRLIWWMVTNESFVAA